MKIRYVVHFQAFDPSRLDKPTSGFLRHFGMPTKETFWEVAETHMARRVAKILGGEANDCIGQVWDRIVH